MRWLFVLAAGLALPLWTLRAQDSVGTACPVENGLLVSYSAGGSAELARALGAPRSVGTSSDRVIDTTWRFDIPERRWTRPWFSASIALGWTSTEGVRGTTSAPAASAAPSASACAGVAIGMRDPTLVLKGARGVVHLRADGSVLSRVRRALRDSTKQPRRN